VDAILLVVKPDTCNLTTIKQTLEQFKRVGGNVVGIALNEIETKSARYSYHYKNYAYYQIYHDDYAPPSKNGHGKNGKVHVDLQEVSAKADSFDLPPTDDLKS
jgi:Mrp family chromosome partitioning ATPase